MSHKYGNGTRRMEADGWNWKSISNIILLENGSHRKRYLGSRSAIVYRCFQNSFASASYTKEKASPFRSLVEKCDRIYDPRIDHPWLYTGKISVKHRDEIYVSRYFSFIRGTRHDDSLKIIERKREREGEYQSSRDNQFSSAVRFSICIMFLFEKFHKAAFVSSCAIFVINSVVMEILFYQGKQRYILKHSRSIGARDYFPMKSRNNLKLKHRFKI